MTGQQPSAGTRAPGELWTTFPDKQLGVIDASKTAQPLIAVRFFSTTAIYAAGDYVVQAGQLYRSKSAVAAGAFNPAQWTLTGGSVLVSAAAPSNPTPGDMWFDAAGGQLYVYYNDGDTSQWVVAVNQNIAGGVYLPLGGGAMSGDIVNGAVPDPTIAKGIANKRYVDAVYAALAPGALGDNRLVNGDMRIDQRNNGAGGIAGGYTVDRWAIGGSLAPGHGTWGRNIGAFSGPVGFPYYLGYSVSSAITPAAADALVFQQPIEADTVSDFAWGSASAQPVTLSFWAQSTLTGTFGGSIRNNAGTRSYPFTFSLPAAITWTKIVVVIPGDTAGAWVMSSNAASLLVAFDLGTGSTGRGPAGAWASTQYLGATGSVSLVTTLNAYFFVTGVKLEIGSVATPFNRYSLAKSMADCERYYSAHGSVTLGGAGVNGSPAYSPLGFPVTMRATPTVAFTPAGLTGCTGGTAAAINADGFTSIFNMAATVWAANATWTASAEL